MKGQNTFLKRRVFIFFAGIALWHQSLFGQVVDPAILEALKNKSTSGRNVSVTSPLDQARQQELRDRQDRLLQQRKEKLAELSRLEKDFQNRLDSEITQFGYSIFEDIPFDEGVMTGSIPDSYRLGIGDKLIVTFQGSKSQTFAVKIDLEGRAVIPELKPIAVNGMSYSDFKSLLKKRVEESIIGTEVFVSLATVRNISVLVAGEVDSPGVVRTSSLTTPLEILMAAGGVKKTGSLRHITIYRGDKKTTLDIYAVLTGRNTDFTSLNDGDRIIVPTIGATIALDGEVVRPGIYELPAGEQYISYAQAMTLAGGTLRPSGYEMSQIKIDKKGRQNFRKIKKGEKIYSGEAIIARLIENSQTGQVELSGHVKIPGFRSLSNTPNISSLLGNIRNLDSNPYMLFGLIERVEQATRTRYLESFNPLSLFSEEHNITLRDGDRVIFLGRSDISYLISDFVREVIVSGRYTVKSILPDGKGNPKYCIPLKNLARIINDTQSNRFATATRAVFVRKEVEDVVASQTKGLGTESFTSEGQEQGREQRKLRTEDTIRQEIEEVESMENLATCPQIYKEVENLLPYILEYIVSVDGAVRLPGVYPIMPDTSIASLMAVSGGTSNDANLKHIEIATLDADNLLRNLQMKWDYVNGSQTDLAKVTINPGGGIRIPSKFSNFEAGAVLLSGEFIQPGVYTIRKGERLSDLMTRAGGITEQAYTYGAIFTRDRVKEIQRAELKKTARQLRSAMVSASVKKNIEADSLVAAQQLTDQLVNAELIGRIVIEADPVKLSLDPTLDTVLEAGDTIYMPKRPNFIIAMGDVLNPGALQFIPGKGIAQYINEVGSYTRSADEGRIYIVYPNGVAKPISLSSWGGNRDISIPPGTAIVVPTDLGPFDTLSLVKEIGDIFRNLAVSAASIAVLIR